MVEVFRYEVRDSGHFVSTPDGARVPPAGSTPSETVLELQHWDRERLAETLAALGADGARQGRTLHVVVPDGVQTAARGAVRLHTSVAAALSAARARHSPVSAF